MIMLFCLNPVVQILATGKCAVLHSCKCVASRPQCAIANGEETYCEQTPLHSSCAGWSPWRPCHISCRCQTMNRNHTSQLNYLPCRKWTNCIALQTFFTLLSNFLQHERAKRSQVAVPLHLMTSRRTQTEPHSEPNVGFYPLYLSENLQRVRLNQKPTAGKIKNAALKPKPALFVPDVNHEIWEKRRRLGWPPDLSLTYTTPPGGSSAPRWLCHILEKKKSPQIQMTQLVSDTERLN